MTTAFGHLLRAEWTKFRTVRGWVIALVGAAAAMVGLGLMVGAQGSCGQHGPGSECVALLGPDGTEVTDNFYFVRQPLTGDGSITVRVTSLTGLIPSLDGEGERPGLVGWAKAGLIIKASTHVGSAYAAVMVTGNHGVRMQYNYRHDTAGPAGTVTPASPRWLRLTRAGSTVTGFESSDGTHWTTVDRVELGGLPTTVQAGLFTTSPQYSQTDNQGLGLPGAAGGPSQATGVFDQLDRAGTWSDPAWTGTRIGGPDNATGRQLGRFEQTGDTFTVTGSGDIAPSVSGASGIGTTISQTLVGTFVALTIVIVVATMFITGEYRRGLIATTMTASPHRGRILAAKSIVVGSATFLIGLVAATVVVTFGPGILRNHGAYVHVATTATEVRVIVGTAALLAVSAILGLAIGMVLRRSAAAVAAVIVVIVLPYLLAISVLPGGAGQWLLRVTPAAAFALQQSEPQYAQVDNLYLPALGYFPLAPWAGFAVLAAWTVAALGVAGFLLRRRDV